MTNTNFPKSTTIFTFQLDDAVRMKLAAETKDTLPKIFRPELNRVQTLCKCGMKWGAETKYCDGFLYYSRGRILGKVFYRKCSNFKCELHYDGAQDGIFNYSGQTLVSYTLLLEYFAAIKTGKMTWTAFAAQKDFLYNNAYCNDKMECPFMDARTWQNV